MNIQLTDLWRQNLPINHTKNEREKKTHAQQNVKNVREFVMFSNINHGQYVIILSHLPYNWLIDLNRYIRIVALK